MGPEEDDETENLLVLFINEVAFRLEIALKIGVSSKL
jgi:hypothetical protein